MASRTLNGATTTYAYDAANRLEGDSEGNDYSYDASGNLVSITGGTRASTTYDYNALGRMTSATVGDSSVSYTYDPAGRMALRVGAGQEERHIFRALSDEPARIERPGGATDYARTPSGALLAIAPAGGEPLFAGADAHTDLVFTAGTSTGQVASSRLYDPYGRVQAQAGDPEALGFQSDYTDELTGLVDMGLRLYDPACARFVTEDPASGIASDPTSFNPYLYASGAPLGRIDPDGTSWWNPWDWCKSAYNNVVKPAASWINNNIVQPVYNNVVRPALNAAANAAKWVGKTCSNVAKKVSRTVVGGIRALGRGVAAIGKGIGRGVMAGLRGLGAAAYYAGKGIADSIGHAIGGLSALDSLSSTPAASGFWDWCRKWGKRALDVIKLFNPVTVLADLYELYKEWRTNDYIDQLIADSREKWKMDDPNALDFGPRAHKTKQEIWNDFMYGDEKKQIGMFDLKKNLAGEIAEFVFTSVWTTVLYHYRRFIRQWVRQRLE